MSKSVPVGVRLSPEAIADLTAGGQKIGEAVRDAVEEKRARLRCPRGHWLAGNTNKAGRCRTCEVDRVRAYKQSKRAQAAS